MSCALESSDREIRVGGWPPYRFRFSLASREGVPHPSRFLQRVGGRRSTAFPGQETLSSNSAHTPHSPLSRRQMPPTRAKSARVGHSQLNNATDNSIKGGPPALSYVRNVI